MKKHTNDDRVEMLIPATKEAVSWGADDPKIVKVHTLAKEITVHLDLDDAAKDEVDFLADRIMDKLESALMYYQMITADNFESRNISQKRTIYEGLYANLWSFYKGRVQNYLKAMGWNLGFLFCNDMNLEKEAKKFVDENPDHEALVDLARKQRQAWQNNFGDSRNASEHTGDYRDGTETYETPGDAQRLFAQVCWTAETIIAYCGSYKMKKEWNITELNPKNNIFHVDERYIMEHAIQTSQREKTK